MAKSPPPPAPPAGSASSLLWLSHALVAVCGVCVGIIATYLALRPQLHRPAVTVSGSVAGALTPDGLPALPPAGLTQGLAPAEADRTLGNFYYDQGNWSQAIRYYESALRQGADDADIRTDLGNVYQFVGRAGDALAEYQRAQEMNPQHEFSLFNQGGLYLNGLHEPAKAAETWTTYLARFPNGRHAAAARQLLAQAAGPAASPPPAASTPAAPDSTEARLLKLVSPAPPAPPAKP